MAHNQRSVKNDSEPQQMLPDLIQYISADARQVASLMQQVDELRAEVAHLRQYQVERVQSAETVGGDSETSSMMLPDYASIAVVPRAHLHRPTSFESEESSEGNSTLLPDYSSIDGPRG